ncbi:MAG TPA: carboxypeptidase regulatory-like domain-containing protein [Phycisphaerae bacterium]|nr:carboxypeptidase regulatory-like domain-containing protein [Phycisphaerae bacterium]
MNTPAASIVQYSAILFDVTIKAALILGTAGMLLMVLRRASAVVRHLIITTAILGVLCLPVLAMCVPVWRLEILPPVVATALSPVESQISPPSTPVYMPERNSPITASPSIPNISINLRQYHPSSDESYSPVSTPLLAAKAQAQTAQPVENNSPSAPIKLRSLLTRGNVLLVVMGLWALGAACVLLFFFTGIIATRRLGRIAHSESDGKVLDLFVQLCKEFRLRRSVRLLISPSSDMPATWGIFHPTVMLPSDAAAWPKDQLLAVLVHELAHVKRWDCATQFASWLACALYWFNPQIWFAMRRMRVECERACDDAVLCRGLGATIYAEHLLSIAKNLRIRNLPRIAALPIARPSLFKRRVLAILDAQTNRRNITLRLFCITVFIAVLFIAPIAAVKLVAGQSSASASGSSVLAIPGKPSTIQKIAATNPAMRTFNLLVIDSKTKKPIPGIGVGLPCGCGPPEKVTGADGHVVLSLSEDQLETLYLKVSGDGWVTKRLLWNAPSIPSTYTVELDRGVRISGKVSDDAGNPVPGAHVVLWFEDKLKKPNESLMIGAEAITDANGIWTYDGAPKSMKKVDIGVWDYAYTSGSFSDAFYSLHRPPVAKLLNGSYTLKLKRGLALEGVVLDSKGKPIAHAQVGLGYDRVATNVIPPQRTNEKGKFSFAVIPGDQVVITVQVHGYAPELQQFVMGQESPPEVVFHLQPAHDISGTVVDSRGRPIPYAFISFDTWRSFRTLNQNITADQNGHFDWSDAPVDAVYCDVSADGYMDADSIAMTPDQPMIVTLLSLQKFHAAIIDTITGKPINNFRIFVGTARSYQPELAWMPYAPDQYPPDNQVKIYPDGKFDLSVTSQGWTTATGNAIRIEADGYLPAESKIYPFTDTDVSLVMKLTPAKNLSATVLDIDGKPAAGAQAYMYPNLRGSSIDLEESLKPNTYYQLPKTSNDGHIEFAPQTGPFKVILFNQSGVAVVNQNDLAKSPTIRLEPWGVFKGRLLFTDKPAKDQVMEIISDLTDPNADIYQHLINFDNNVRTDANGEFEFKHIPPGKWSVCPWIQTQAENPTGGASPSLPQLAFQIKAGQIITGTLGGVGWTVTGSIILPPGLDLNRGQYSIEDEMLPDWLKPPEPPMPAQIKNGSKEQQFKWYSVFAKTPSAKAFSAEENNYYRQCHWYAMTIQSDNTFSIYDVVPGKYTIMVQISAIKDYTNIIPVASAQTQFSVPAISDGAGDKVLIAPPIRLKASGNQINPFYPMPDINPGDIAPDFALKTLDGKNIRLADFRDKYVLLYFWGTWSSWGSSQIPALKAIYKKFSSDKRFVIIGLNVDDTPQPARDYVAKYGLNWIQGYVGPWIENKTPIMDQYAVDYIPWYCLIGPDGRIITIGDYPDAVKPAIQSALSDR